MDTEKSNKLIAQFMGFNVISHISPSGRKGFLGYGFNNPPYSMDIHNMNYYDTEEKSWKSMLRFADFHKSWDWLIPVVKKILWMDESKFKKETDIWLTYWSLDAKMSNLEIESIYQTVVEFIELYNKNE